MKLLWTRVKDALLVLPSQFTTEVCIAGISVPDLFTYNTPIGSSIEQNVVDGLNRLRPIWDPDNKYLRFRFVRQPNVFPDVRLQSEGSTNTATVLMGIELKGWYAMAKEGEPSFRYKVSGDVCAPQDLLVIYPWVLKDAVRGAPILLAPFITEARYAAELRNHYWQVERRSKGEDAQIHPALYRLPYPPKGSATNDEAAADKGGNFGRVSRGGKIMDSFITALMEETQLLGLSIGEWQKFFKSASGVR